MPTALTTVLAFETELGWTVLAAAGEKLTRLAFGHRTRSEALMQMPAPEVTPAKPPGWLRELARRLENYASGMPEDFGDVPLESYVHTPFAAKVIRCCRSIPYGEVRTYGELAAQAGSPGAARAVGNAMASNRYPLIVPCHRVVGSDGRLGGFSAPQGIALKQRLLDMEQAAGSFRPLSVKAKSKRSSLVEARS